MALDKTQFTDLTLKFADRERKVHKIVMYLASEWFRTALTGPFRVCCRMSHFLLTLTDEDQEAQETSIQLDDDDPEALDDLIALCYLDDNARRLQYIEERSRSKDNDITLSLNAMIVADKYGFHSVLEVLSKYTAEIIHSYELGTEDHENFFRAVDICFSISIAAFSQLKKSMLVIMQTDLANMYSNIHGTAYKALMLQLSKHAEIGASLIADLNPFAAQKVFDVVGCNACDNEYIATSPINEKTHKGYYYDQQARRYTTHYCPTCRAMGHTE